MSEDIRLIDQVPPCDHIIDAPTMNRAVAAIDGRILARTPAHRCIVNVGKVVPLRDDPRPRETVRSCAVFHADGQVAAWAARLLGANPPRGSR